MRPVSLALALAVATTACLSDDKPTIADAPFAGDYDGKEDSWLTPWNGGRLAVGDARTDGFTASRGWIAYEIELAEGPVDLDLAAADGTPNGIDTLLVVYGPRSASGLYPRGALAVNDDVGPGNLSSHLLLDVPTPGLYRVVVSTYDNYVEWPLNVSRGDYRLTIKCPRIDAEGLDACGPHRRQLGEGCFDDVVCGAGNTCEGEVTCLPGTQCLWVREGVCAGATAWVTAAARQCGDNPWQTEAPTGDGEEAGFADPELEAIDAWLEDLGIDARSLGRVDTEADAVCLACSCPRGDVILVEASTADAARLVDGHGFSYATGEWRATSPVQCGGNPWQAGQASDEVGAVRAWAAAAGARLGMVGFVVATEPRFHCLACSCDRGDLLVVTPSAATPPAALDALGFGALYR
jgi:hypothetical protein